MAYPFVIFDRQLTANINSTPTIIFGEDQHTCFVQGVIITNMTDNIILVTLYRAIEETPGIETDIVTGNKIPVQPYCLQDILAGTYLIIKPGDLLYALSDFSGNIFNTTVNFHKLTEL